MPDVRVDGPIATATAANLALGVGGSSMQPDAVRAVFDQSAALMARIVAAYEARVGPGEVGRDGSAEAGDAAPVGAGNGTGLLYGRVQSGKTAAMIAAAALAFDNGFRLVIVLTANSVALVRQTERRFRAVARVEVLSTLREGPDYGWQGDEADLADDLRADGLVLVCAKDTATHLPNVLRLLQDLDAAGVPALIFDDEADAATPDTTAAARSAGAPNAPDLPSTTYRRVVENAAIGEEGESVRQLLPHHVYVEVTATPYVLFLQRGDSPLRPQFVHLAEPGAGYCGGEVFFAPFAPGNPADPAPPLVLLPPGEAVQLAAARRGAPAGLQAALAFFLLSASAHALRVRDGLFPDEGYKFLAHTSLRVAQHAHVAGLARRYLKRVVRSALRDPAGERAREVFGPAYAELSRTAAQVPAPGLPSLDALLEFASRRIADAEVVVVNAETEEPRYGRGFNVVVGGNILGRGITIDDLLVTYYLREAQVPQMDTVWQHARMYGYREALLPFTRVFVPRRLAAIFKGIHESEAELRGVLPALAADAPVPLRVVAGTRATRPNAVEASATRVYAGGRQIRPLVPVRDAARVATAGREIVARLAALGVPTDAPPGQRFRTVPLDALIELLRLVPVDPDDARFTPDGAGAVLASLRASLGAEGQLYVRRTRSEREELTSGVLTGPEQGQAAASSVPTLALAYGGQSAAAADFWFPTLVLPASVGNVVFNALG